jgi:hypothetical protein
MDVEIKLDGKPEMLRCSLKAAKRVNAAGGFQQVLGRLQSADLEFFTLVVAAGLDKQPSEVEGRVYRTGLPALGADLAKYANLLANGGKPFRPMKLKTVEIEGKTYAELNERGEPAYVEDEPAGVAGEGEA